MKIFIRNRLNIFLSMRTKWMNAEWSNTNNVNRIKGNKIVQRLKGIEVCECEKVKQETSMNAVVLFL